MSNTEISGVRKTTAGNIFMNSVLRELRRQLENCPYAAVKELRCEFHDGVVTIRGRLPTFYTHQVALGIVTKVVGGMGQIDDRTVVAGLAAGQQ